MQQIYEVRKLTMMELRGLCIRHDWYTRGNNGEYSRLLSTAEGIKNVTTADIAALAQNILEHSDTEHGLTSICFEIARVCYSVFSEYPE